MAEKLVRDLIPEIVAANGDTATTRVLSDEEYLKALDKKLQEEVDEYLEANDLAELGDVLEVIRAIAMARGASPEKLELLRQQKFEERGGFEAKIAMEL